jgi:TonB family protein
MFVIPHSTRLLLLVILAATMFVFRIEAQTKDAPFPIDGYAQPPERTKVVAPDYPADAPSGTVVLRVKIDPEGHVDSVTVVRPVANATDAAVKAVLQWEYTPVQLNGERIWIVMTVNIPCPWKE